MKMFLLVITVLAAFGMSMANQPIAMLMPLLFVVIFVGPLRVLRLVLGMLSVFKLLFG